MNNIISKYFVLLFCLTSLYSCQKVSEVIIENNTNEVLNVKICRIEEIDISYLSQTKEKLHSPDFKDYPVINPRIIPIDNNSFVPMIRDSNSTCVKFKINPNQKTSLIFDKEYKVFNHDKICEMIGSIEISNNDKTYFVAQKQNVYKKLKIETTFFGDKTIYLLKINSKE
jgi:hypothetical protein